MDDAKRRCEVFISGLKDRLSRQVAGSLLGCVRCGVCTEACHYVHTHPGDPSYVPAVKAQRIAMMFKRHVDWLGPFGAGATIEDKADLEALKDMAFGKCTNCRRCSVSCPMGVDFATINRMVRGLLVSVDVVPEGVRVVSRDQWEIGNQMGVLEEEYLDTLEWQAEELADTLDDPTARIPVDEQEADFVYAINPREVKYDPRSIFEAAKIFHLMNERWTMASEGWDMTNFGLFSGDDALGSAVARRVYDSVTRLKAKRLVLSECGHGFRSTTCEGPNWANMDVPFPIESVITLMLRYVDEGRVTLDPTRNAGTYTYHDSCNLARSCGMFEEPRRLLRQVVTDFREMWPNRAENYCCTGGGGAMSMSEYTADRLKSARIKAEQLAATGADTVVTSCHNCVDGLTDVIKHYKLNMKVVQLIHLFANAMAKVDTPAVREEKPLLGQKVLVIDDDPDAVLFLTALLEDNGAEVTSAGDGDTGLCTARASMPDIITLDLSMPGRDGTEIFRDLRRDPVLSSLKVCIITGRPEMRHLIYEYPVRRPEVFLNKPLTEENLVQTLRKIVDCE